MLKEDVKFAKEQYKQAQANYSRIWKELNKQYKFLCNQNQTIKKD